MSKTFEAVYTAREASGEATGEVFHSCAQRCLVAYLHDLTCRTPCTSPPRTVSPQ